MSKSKELIDHLKAQRGLPTPPGVALRLLELIRGGGSSISEVSAALGCDPVLTGRMLAYANSPMVGAASEVSSLQRAVTMLGMRRVAVLALSYCFVDMTNDISCDGFDCEGFWQESLALAVLARNLARNVAPAEADEAFLTGLVGGMGRLVLATGMPEDYGHILRNSEHRDEVKTLESQRLGVTSEEMGVALLREWNFPASVVEWVCEGHMLRSGKDPISDHRLPRCLCIAQLGAETIVDPQRSNLDQVERIYDLAARVLGLEQAQWDELFAQCVEEWKAQCQVLDISSHEVQTFAEIEAQAREQLAMLSIAAVSESEEMFERATTDDLTGIANRSSFNSRLELEVERFRRDGGNLLLMMIDIDHFKSFNDQYGHQLGDTVLKAVAEALRDRVRRVDFCARYGGEEFAVIAPQCEREHAIAIAERLREGIEELRLDHEGKPLSATISVGCAYARMAGCTEAISNDLVSRADKHLYIAKHEGRNCCRIDPADLPSREALPAE